MARKPIIDRDDAARPGTDGSEEAGAESVSEGPDLFVFRSDISRNVVSDEFSDPFAVRADVEEVVASANVGQEGFSELSDIPRNVVPDDAGQHALATALGDGGAGDDLSFISRSSEHEGVGDYFTDGTGDDRSYLVSDLPYTDPNETTLDDTLGQALDASTQQGGAPALQDQVVTGIGLTENLVADSTEAIEEEEVDAPDATEVT